MAALEKQRRISKGLLITLIFLILVAGLLISKSYMINNLDEATIAKLAECLMDNNTDIIDHNRHINEILAKYEMDRREIDKRVVNNGLTSLLISLLIILTSVKKIIKTIKSILYELFNGKNNDTITENSKEDSKLDLFMNMENREKLLTNISKYKHLREAIEQFNSSKEKDKHQDERIMILERTMMLLIEEFAGTLGHTSNYADQMNNDKEQLLMGMNEIKKGMEQIVLVINDEENKGYSMSKEEMMAALEQIDTAMEETATLILEMDKKVKTLSRHIDQYK